MYAIHKALPFIVGVDVPLSGPPQVVAVNVSPAFESKITLHTSVESPSITVIGVTITTGGANSPPTGRGSITVTGIKVVSHNPV